MGRISKELKEISAEAYPILNKDYYLVRSRQGEMGPIGWLYSVVSKSAMPTARIVMLLDKFAKGHLKAQPAQRDIFGARWYLMPGPKPDKKWGPVCP